MEDRIRKLMQTAKSYAEKGNDEAAETYLMKAAQLGIKYGIDAALLDAQAGKVEQREIVFRQIPLSNPYKLHKTDLLFGIARVSNCYAVVFQNRVRRNVLQYTMKIAGTIEDLNRVDLLYMSLTQQLETAVKRTEIPYWEHGKTYRHAWVGGWVQRVVWRLHDLKNESVQESSTGTDIVLADLSKRAEAKMLSVHQEVRKDGFKGAKEGSSGQGTRDGYVAGGSARLGTGELVH